MEVNLYSISLVQDQWDVKESLRGSLRLVKYKVQENKRELLTMTKRYEGEYMLSVSLPSVRSVDVVANIIKSSANKFRVMYSDSMGTELVTCCSYAELSRYLRSKYVKPKPEQPPER